MYLKSKMIFLSFLLLAGCSTIRPDMQTLNINCNPDVILKVNGDRYDCPAKVDVRRDKTAIIEATQPGYDHYLKMIGCHLSVQAKADVVGTAFLFFPVFGLLAPGAWDLDETEVNVILYKLE
ncbi:MAG: hypothetical protein ABIJ59_16460 [Pseudomonadota bacterium]